MPPPNVTDDEYNQNMDNQAINKCLCQSLLTFDFLKKALNQPLENLLRFIGTYDVDDTSTTTTNERQNIHMLKYILTDYHANCIATTGLLSFIWYEKSSMSYKQLVVYLPSSGSKLFDGIGTNVKDKVERVLIECSGDVDGEHTECMY
ncbi:unnamed protein product [Absidia cylindrospora]